MMLTQRHPRVKDEPHRRFVASFGCVICGGESQAAHISYPELAVGKKTKAHKADDYFTVPLCPHHHAAQHAMNEKEWWEGYGIDPIKLALALRAYRDDREHCEFILAMNRP